MKRSADSSGLPETHLLWMLLAATSAAGDDAQRAQLLATGVPSLIPCALSGVALRGGAADDARWTVAVQTGGTLLAEEDVRPLHPQLGGLLDASLSGGPLSRTEPLPPVITECGARRLLLVPIRSLEGPLGMLLLGSAEAEPESPHVVTLLQILADRTAMAIENARMHDDLEQLVDERTAQLERSRGRLRVLLDVNNAIIANLDREGLFRAVAETVQTVVAYDRASIALFDAETETLTVSVLAGVTASTLFPEGQRTPLPESPIRAVIEERRAVVCRDLAAKARRTPNEDALLAEGIRAYVSVPLIENDHVIGALNVGTRSLARNLDLDAEVLGEVANQVALAITNMRAYEQIAELKARVEQDNQFLQEEIETQRSGEIVGRSAGVQALLREIDLVARTDATVLIQGESGTGKELVARELHKRSKRCDGPMIKVNCASIPTELYESEFFGHVKGAFTGALRDRAGRFELADGGTLFLDEVGEIPLLLQSKLLRVLQDGEFERVGDGRTRSVDARIVAATNRDLAAEVAAGRFRQDLYYRLSVFPIDVLPLRERKEDIPVLAAHFLEMAGRRLNRPHISLTRDGEEQLLRYDWPGNVRELQNRVERALILAPSGAPLFDLPAGKSRLGNRPGSPGGDGGVHTYPDLKRRERENLIAALEQTGWQVYGDAGAASLLDVKPTTLLSRMKSMGIEKP